MTLFENDQWGHFTPKSVTLIASLRKQPTLSDISPRGFSRVLTNQNVISMEFLSSFLRPHFAGKPVVTSRNVGCFLILAQRRSQLIPSKGELSVTCVITCSKVEIPYGHILLL